MILLGRQHRSHDLIGMRASFSRKRTEHGHMPGRMHKRPDEFSRDINKWNWKNFATGSN